MAFFCPVRIRRNKKKHGILESDLLSGTKQQQQQNNRNLFMGRITGSSSIETLVRVGIEKENGLSPNSKMIVLHDFKPCVDDELEVKRGQIINILYQENDWVYVISADQRDQNGQLMEGFIPISYCAPLIETNIDNLLINFKKKMPRNNNNDCVMNNNNNTFVDYNFNEINIDKNFDQINFNNNNGDNLNQNNDNNLNINFIENGNYCNQIISTNNNNNSDNDINFNYQNSPKQFNIDSISQQKNSNIMNLDLIMATTTTTTPSTTTTTNNINQISNNLNNFKFDNINYNDQQLLKKSTTPSYFMATTTTTTKNSTEIIPNVQPFYKDYNHNNYQHQNNGRYVMLYTFIARDENDLSVERGEIITVLNKDDNDWYWVRRSDSQEGFVPATFTYPIDLLLNAHVVHNDNLQYNHNGQMQQNTNILYTNRT